VDTKTPLPPRGLRSWGIQLSQSAGRDAAASRRGDVPDLRRAELSRRHGDAGVYAQT